MRGSSGNHLGDHIEMIEVGEVEYLQIETVGTGVLPASASTTTLRRRGRQSRSAQFVRLPSNCCRPLHVLAFIGADGDDQRGGKCHRCRVPSDCRTRIEDPLTLGGEIINRAKAQIELGGKSSRQSWGPTLSTAADDDREMAALCRLRERRRIGQLVVFAGEREGLPSGRRPQSGDDLELLLEPFEAFAEIRKRDAVGGVLLFVPTGTRARARRARQTSDRRWRRRSPARQGGETSPRLTSVPRRIVEVSRASPASVIQASVGPGRPPAASASPIAR